LGLPPSQFDAALEQLVRSTHGIPTEARDTALIYLHMGTGLWPGEIAALQVRDFMDERGNVLRTTVLRAEIARFGKERPLLWVNPTLVSAILNYLDERVAQRVGTRDTKCFRGLDPDSQLVVVTEEGSPVEVKDGRRTARPMYVVTNNVFHRSGTGLQPRDGRRLFAQRLYELGADPSTICDLLGRHRSRFRDWLDHKPSDAIRAQALLCHAY
jgi:integrase